ncbi:formate dehydrogenase accessory sulfurtransferase FdhD [Paraglaciecola sp. L1A13]|uniref:formate dehydrogenase accessory sulfurtransferase FdhD n=1 Tax=Paraglaciecola sp. L1A13 TaxID=2686359 RepID=UPI00131EA9C0|nr:formate dehydrogenase accessory sulfurtransferase FdhD [Paraglaciecola sp. L1A13]
MNNVNSFPITRLTSSSSLAWVQDPEQIEQHILDDNIASEEPLEIWIKHPLKNNAKANLLLTTMRSPGDDIALVRGWLHTSGLIENSADVQRVTHTGSQRIKGKGGNQVLVSLHPQANFDFSAAENDAASHIEYVNSGCGVCGQRSIDVLLDKRPRKAQISEPALSVQSILSLANALRQGQTAFSLTGGSHGAGLFSLESLPIVTEITETNEWLLDVREDIGRHNALDKLIGAQLPVLLDAKEHNYGVILSSRISFDLVQKAAMSNLHFILAMGAPSSLAIELAQECDICLVGFIQQKRINIYTCAHRVSR